MKKALIGFGMLALACMVCGPALAADVPHPPLAANSNCVNYQGMIGTPPVPTYYAFMLNSDPDLSPPPPGFAAYGAANSGSWPKFSLGAGTNYDTTVTFPTPGNYDFCAAFDTASCSLGALSYLSDQVITYMAVFLCTTDINGPLNPDPDADLPVTGNLIPDGEFELGLLAAVLNDTYPLTGTTTNEQVRTAYQANIKFFQKLVLQAISNIPIGKNGVVEKGLDGRTILPGVAPYVVPCLTAILAGYATEGDPASLDALDALLDLLSVLNIAKPDGGVRAWTTGFGSILGPEGDADGDSYTNRREYNAFKADGAAKTIEAQLKASITPPASVASVKILGAGTYVVGKVITLTAVVKDGAGVSYAWSKDGVPVPDGTASQLVLHEGTGVTEADSGMYTVTVVTDADETIDSKAVKLLIVPVGQLPIAGGLGLALLAGACALGGVGSIRRRK